MIAGRPESGTIESHPQPSLSISCHEGLEFTAPVHVLVEPSVLQARAATAEMSLTRTVLMSSVGRLLVVCVLRASRGTAYSNKPHHCLCLSGQRTIRYTRSRNTAGAASARGGAPCGAQPPTGATPSTDAADVAPRRVASSHCHWHRSGGRPQFLGGRAEGVGLWDLGGPVRGRAPGLARRPHNESTLCGGERISYPRGREWGHELFSP